MESTKKKSEDFLLQEKQKFIKRLEFIIEDVDGCDDFKPAQDRAKYMLLNLDKFIELYYGKAVAMAGTEIRTSDISGKEAAYAVREAVPNTQTFYFEFWNEDEMDK